LIHAARHSPAARDHSTQHSTQAGRRGQVVPPVHRAPAQTCPRVSRTLRQRKAHPHFTGSPVLLVGKVVSLVVVELPGHLRAHQHTLGCFDAGAGLSSAAGPTHLLEE
jgi:hypothetical protein